MRIRTAVSLIAAAGMACAITGAMVSHRLKARYAAELSAQRTAWEEERAALRAAVVKANVGSRRPAAPIPARAAAPPVLAEKPTPAELIAGLRALRFTPGPAQSRQARQAIHTFEQLIAAGPAALPAIREFLARNEDVDFAAAGQGRGGRGGVPADFILPPSLRFGLFDVVKQIGGDDAEKLLAETLGMTGRGVELAWLARALQESAPDKYRTMALGAARDLLARPAPVNPASPLDAADRDQLFGVLAMYSDTSYVAAAQAQLLQADGAVDRSALRYLQQSLGKQSVAIAAQMWNDPRLADPTKKEPLARLALNFVGADAPANEFYQKAINDLNLPRNDRKNLIEDLNQDGFADLRNLGARDLPLIQNRIALIEQLAPQTTDPVNTAAFQEAYKDLLNMRERAQRPPAP